MDNAAVTDVTIYTKKRCVHCMGARRRLRRRGAAIHEIAAGRDVEAMRGELLSRFGVSTFPQIVIGERHIGGAAELVKLDKEGGLERLLASEGTEAVATAPTDSHHGRAAARPP